MPNKMLCSCYNLYSARGDRAHFLERIRHEAGATGLRVFALQLWGTEARRLADVHYLPKDLPWVNKFFWHGFNRQQVQCEIAPMLDMEHLSMDWWDRRAELLRKMKDLGLELHEVCIDHCSMRDMWDERADGPNPGPNKFWIPWLSNIQFWRGDSIPTFDQEPGWGGLWNFDEPDGPFKWFFEFAKHLIYTGQEILGDKYYLESFNEKGNLGWPDAHDVEWCRRFHEKILAETGLDKSHLKYSGGLVSDIEKQVGVVCFHGHATPESINSSIQAHNFYDLPTSRVEISGDGGTDGDGPQDDMSNAGMSIEQAKEMAAIMKSVTLPTYESFNFSIEALPAGHTQADVDQFNPAAHRAFAEAFLDRAQWEICDDTGFKANEYCPNKVIDTFVPGTEPQEICALHKKPEPPTPPTPPQSKCNKLKHWLFGPNSCWGRLVNAR